MFQEIPQIFFELTQSSKNACKRKPDWENAGCPGESNLEGRCEGSSSNGHAVSQQCRLLRPNNSHFLHWKGHMVLLPRPIIILQTNFESFSIWLVKRLTAAVVQWCTNAFRLRGPRVRCQLLLGLYLSVSKLPDFGQSIEISSFSFRGWWQAQISPSLAIR